MPERKRVTRHPLIELTIVRLKEFLREPDAVFWVFAFPLLLTVALGFAFREKAPDKIPVGVAEGPAAQQRMAMLQKSPALLPRLYSLAEGREELRRGKISLFVEGEASPVYRLDPTRPDARTARVEVDDALQGGAGRKDVFAAKEEHVVEHGSRYIDFLVPGLIGMNLMGTSMWSIGFSVVNARLRKLLKRMLATPMRKRDFLLAQALSRLAFLVVEVGVVVIFAKLVFDVSIRGSFAAFSVVCLAGGAAFAAIGLFISSRAKTLEAISGLMNVVMMPMWICSGVFFSYERFPDAVKPVIRALPLTALNDALRAVMNDGHGFVQVAPQLINLTIWTVVTYLVGLKIFRWQ
ncbi:MAG TPA: ABC transporter permease [Thermoanaerobaculia bacterium]|nr:ABC transporter permease [Thermoanaerobaculia bacterium]